MEKRDWLILKTVFEEKSLTKAAEQLFLSQPALTYRLQQIEKELKADLFLRGRRGVAFTEKGEYVAKYAEKMLRELEKMERGLKHFDNKVSGILRLGVSRSYAFYELSNVLKDFHENHPEVKFNVHSGLNLDLINTIYKQDVHIGIIRGDHHWPNQKLELKKEHIYIISKDPFEFNNLPSMPRIFYKTDPALNMVIDNWWKSYFEEPPLYTMEVDNMEIAKKMTQNGLGYSIVPGITFEANDRLNKMVLMDEKKEPITWTTWLIYLKETLKINAVREFINFITLYYNNRNS